MYRPTSASAAPRSGSFRAPARAAASTARTSWALATMMRPTSMARPTMAMRTTARRAIMGRIWPRSLVAKGAASLVFALFPTTAYIPPNPLAAVHGGHRGGGAHPQWVRHHQGQAQDKWVVIADRDPYRGVLRHRHHVVLHGYVIVLVHGAGEPAHLGQDETLDLVVRGNAPRAETSAIATGVHHRHIGVDRVAHFRYPNEEDQEQRKG